MSTLEYNPFAPDFYDNPSTRIAGCRTRRPCTAVSGSAGGL